MMNLDEAISHAREKAEENKKAASRFAYPDKAGTTKESADCLECAKEHEQLAEWLMELKKLREENKGEWIAREDMDYLDENKVVHKHFECNKCGLVHDFIDGHTSQYNFCPNCKADMRGKEE